MAITPYRDLKSEDILSSHLSGLQHDINKLQTILNTQVSSVVDYKLSPVEDQNDASLRFYIYECDIRNWLNNPIPRIYRDGSFVDESEYVLYAPYGAVLFKQQQNANSVITADFSYINDVSKTINDIKSDIDKLKADLSNAESGNSSQGTRMFLAKGLWASHNRNAWADVFSNTIMAANLVDAFPFPVGHKMRLDRIAVRVDTTAGLKGALAIYKDTDGYPGELVVNGGNFDTTTTGWKRNTIDIELGPGMYWLVRNQDSNCGMAGWRYHESLPIGFDPDTIPWQSHINEGTNLKDAGFYGGYRLSSTIGLNGTWPNTFPEGASPFSRVKYASIFVRRA